MLDIETVAVMGASDAATACAALASLAGCAVRVHAPAADALAAAVDALRRRVERAHAAGTLTPDERQRIFDGVIFTADLEEAVTAADLVIDAAGGGPPARFEDLAALLRATTALAAAGATPAVEIAARVPQPGRVLELGLVEPPGAVPRVEIRPAARTAEHVLARAEAFAARVNRSARVVKP
jgi:3-hydroxybutyryl-CoA dehydrogenase